MEALLLSGLVWGSASVERLGFGERFDERTRLVEAFPVHSSGIRLWSYRCSVGYVAFMFYARSVVL